MNKNYELQIIKIIENEAWLIDILKEIRELKLNDWYVAAGSIRNTIWNVLHGFSSNKNLKDIDIVYFDKSNLSKEKEQEIELILKLKNPKFIFFFINQARKHSIHPGLKINSSCESIDYWSETPTCIGVRLEENNKLTICAPHGLHDLMNLIVQPIPKPYQDLELYKKRIEQKKWKNIWPRLKIVNV